MAKKDHWLQAKYEMECRNRQIVYAIAAPYLQNEQTSMYEFMPLEGDPTPEEIEEMMRNEQMTQYKKALAVSKNFRSALEKQTL